MPLSTTPHGTCQLVLQTEFAGGFSCRVFDSIPAVHPCYIVIATDQDPLSFALAARLETAIVNELILGGAHSSSPPCGGGGVPPMGCKAHATPECKKLLVLVSQWNTSTPLDASLHSWGTNGTYCVLPLVEPVAVPRMRTCLPAGFTLFNAETYTHDIESTLPAVLQAVGLAPDERKVFISYRRADTLNLADQLFDALSHKGFDVFLDRFRIPPGVDFQRRLTEELADKAMLIALESPTFEESEWIRYEIGFATKHRLALLAINTPGGKKLSGIGERISLPLTDLAPDGQLLDAVLDRVVHEVQLNHHRMIHYRRRLMTESLSWALSAHGIPNQTLRAGTVSAQGPNGTVHLSVTVRPPELNAFFGVSSCRGAAKGAIVGPVSSLEPDRTARLRWLETISSVLLRDESELADLVSAIAGGTI